MVTQHVLIYSWLLYQYAHQVESRFILHDTEAKEVKDFYTYYNSKVAGGTQVFSAYEKVNQIVKEENLAADYNIYVFHGTDGDDWDTEGKKAIPALREMMKVRQPHRGDRGRTWGRPRKPDGGGALSEKISIARKTPQAHSPGRTRRKRRRTKADRGDQTADLLKDHCKAYCLWN